MSKIKILFLICVGMVAAFDLLTTYAQALKELTDHTTIPLHSLGLQFTGMDKVFNGAPVVGYYTDKDLTKPIAVAQFEQAQYMLAPTVLDLNNTQLSWVIFDCTSPEVAIAAIKRLGLTPLGAHNGIILTINPKVNDQ